MSTSEKVTQFKGKEKSVTFVDSTSKMCIQPHFANHTQSSLMKMRTPLRPKKESSSTWGTAGLKKRVVSSRSSGICKRRSGVMKQNRNLQTLKTILKREKHCHASLRDSESMETACQSKQCVENVFTSLQGDLFKDVSCNFKKSAESPVKPALRDRISHLEDLSTFSTKVSDCLEDPTTLDMCELQTHANVKNCLINACFQSLENLTDNYLQNKDIQRQGRPIVNSNVMSAKKDVLQKNPTSTKTQTIWKPPVVGSSTENMISSSTQSMSKKFQSTEKSVVSRKSKHSAIAHMGVPILGNQSKMLKENRDPRTNRMTKTYEHHLEETKLRRLQGAQALPKKRRSMSTGSSNVSSKCNDANPVRSKSRSRSKPRYYQTRLVTPKKSKKIRNNVEQHCTASAQVYDKSSKSSKVIDTLKEINSVREDEDNLNISKNDIFDHEKSNSELITLSTLPAYEASSKMSRNNKLYFTKDQNRKINSDETGRSFDRSSKKSISTQTELNSSLYLKIDSEKRRESKEILTLKRTIATQTSPCYKKNIREIGCNTTPVTYKNAEVFCDLVNFMNAKESIGLTVIKAESTSDILIRTTEGSIKSTEINSDDEYFNESNKFPLSNSKETLNTEMNLQLEDCTIIKIPARTMSNFVEEKVMHEEACQNSDDKANIDTDKNQESRKSFNNSRKTLTSEMDLQLEDCIIMEIPAETTSDFVEEKVMHEEACQNSDDKADIDTDKNQESRKSSDNSLTDNLFLGKPDRPSSSSYDYDASCSSEEAMEYFENDVHEDTAAPELKVENLEEKECLPSDVIAAFELAAERAGNLHQAIIIHQESLMSRDKQNGETIENCEPPLEDQHRIGKCASFVNGESESETKSECSATEDGEDFNVFSCSSSTCSFTQICESEFRKSTDRRADCSEIDEGEESAENVNAVLKSILNESDVKTLMSLLTRRMQEEYGLEVWNGNDESFEAEKKTLTLPMAEKISIISRENLLPLVCCVLCTVVFWCLQFSFQCDSRA